MLAVDRWTIYYADGSTYTSDQGTWAEAPPFGLICVVYYTPDGRSCFQEVGQDHSIFEYLGTPTGSDTPVKMGLWVDGDTYTRIHDLARRTVTP